MNNRHRRVARLQAKEVERVIELVCRKLFATCPTCGYEGLKPDYKFCVICGTKIERGFN